MTPSFSTHYRRTLRAAGLITVAAVVIYLPLCTSPSTPLASAGLLLGFIALFWRATAEAGLGGSRMSLAAVLGQSGISLALLWLHPFFLLSSLLVIVGWQAGLQMPMRQALLLVIGQTLLAALMLMPGIGKFQVLTFVGAGFGFQLLGLAAGSLAHREAQARADLNLALNRWMDAQPRRLNEARGAERLAIARDLHDELGHGLVALTLELAAGDPAGQRSNATRLAADLLGRVRAVVGQIREPVPDRIDLQAALRDLLATTPLEGCRPTLEAAPATPVDGPRALVVLRLVQEALTNALRHGGPALSRLCVRVALAPDGALTVQVEDDGQPRAGAIRPGLGLRGMQERAALLGGDVSWRRGKDGGFRIDARLPAAAAAS